MLANLTQKLRGKRNALIWGLLLYQLNLVDLCFTVFYLNRGFQESNPVMDYLWQLDPVAFIWTKLLGVALILAGYVAVSTKKWHLLALQAMTGVYFLLALYHISGLFFFFLL